MPIDPVSDDEIIATDWGNSVADAINRRRTLGVVPIVADITPIDDAPAVTIATLTPLLVLDELVVVRWSLMAAPIGAAANLEVLYSLTVAGDLAGSRRRTLPNVSGDAIAHSDWLAFEAPADGTAALVLKVVRTAGTGSFEVRGGAATLPHGGGSGPGWVVFETAPDAP